MDTHCGAHITQYRDTQGPRAGPPPARGALAVPPQPQCPGSAVPALRGAARGLTLQVLLLRALSRHGWRAAGHALTARRPPQRTVSAPLTSAPRRPPIGQRGGAGRGGAGGGARSPSAPGAAMMAGGERGRAGKRESGDGSCGTSSSRRTSSSSEHHHHPQNIIPQDIIPHDSRSLPLSAPHGPRASRTALQSTRERGHGGISKDTRMDFKGFTDGVSKDSRM